MENNIWREERFGAFGEANIQLCTPGCRSSSRGWSFNKLNDHRLFFLLEFFNIFLIIFQVREYVRSIAKPGMLMTDICETLEDTVCKLISENSQLVLVGFNFIFLSTIHYSSLLPMFICDGFLTSRVAAHWIPNSGDNTVLPYDDVMKVDFGTHIDGMTANFSFVSPLYKSHLEINISWVFAVWLMYFPQTYDLHDDSSILCTEEEVCIYTALSCIYISIAFFIFMNAKSDV